MQAGVKDVCTAQTERSEDLGVPALMKTERRGHLGLKEHVGGCNAGSHSPTYL